MHILFQCLGITGVVFIFYGLLALAITQAHSDWFFRLIMGLGVGFVIAFLIAWVINFNKNPQSMKDALKSRSTQSRAGGIIYIIIVLAILAVANVQSQKFFYKTFDFTENKVHTLAEQTISQLNSLSDELTVTAFLDERDNTKGALRELLSKYQAVSPKLKVNYVDPDKDTLLSQQLGGKDGDIVISLGAQNHTIREVSEQAITQAIMKVGRTESSVVCFTTGHGELDIKAPDEDKRSASFLNKGLENEGYRTQVLQDLLGEIDPGCNIVVVAGPEQSFTESEALTIDTYLKSGGKAVFLLDPNFPDPRLFKGKLTVQPTGLENMLSKWGVRLGNNLLLQQQIQLFRGEQIVPQITSRSYGDHPVVDPLKENRQTVFNMVRSVQRDPDFAGIALEIIFSGQQGQSFAVADIDGIFRTQKLTFSDKDIPGPVPFAVAVERELASDQPVEIEEGKVPDKTKLVVIGDSDFASNAMIDLNGYNFDLVLNAVNWLSGEQQQISIRPRTIRASAIELTGQQTNTIFYIVIVALPMLVLIFGLNLWWYRRKRG